MKVSDWKNVFIIPQLDGCLSATHPKELAEDVIQHLPLPRIKSEPSIPAISGLRSPSQQSTRRPSGKPAKTATTLSATILSWTGSILLIESG